MKKLVYFFLFVSICGSVTGCLKDDCEATRTFYIWEPVWVTPGEFRTDISSTSARTLENPGKIYFYNDFVLINELREGVHVIDNSDPQNPIFVSFLEIPGNVDMAVRGDVLYADSYVDLLTIDISDLQNPRLETREEDVFQLNGFDPQRGYLVAYRETEQTMEVTCSDPNFGSGFWFDEADRAFVANGASVDLQASATGNNRSASVGVGGSLARFSIVFDRLYAIDNMNLKVFDLTQPIRPKLASDVFVGWGIETIFPYGEHLFIGAQDGMYIFDNSNPNQPRQLSKFEHARACDPVYVNGDFAYVTLRDGTECQNFNNQLDIVDISDLRNPELLVTYPMHNPHGLSLAQDHLYICENDQGLKVFEASDWRGLDDRMTAHIEGFTSYDVITLPGRRLAMVIGADGFYQFDITDPTNLQELSIIPVERKN